MCVCVHCFKKTRTERTVSGEGKPKKTKKKRRSKDSATNADEKVGHVYTIIINVHILYESISV
jgi:hypothetical protein